MIERVHINTNTVGLVFKRGELDRILTKGTYWVFWKEEVQICDMTQLFFSNKNIDTLLKNEQLAEMLEVINITDNELVLVYEENKFKQVLTAGKHAFWREVTNFSFTRIDLNSMGRINDIDKNLLEKQPLVMYTRGYKIESYEKGLLFIDGKFDSELEAGNYIWWKNSTTINVVKADIRQLTIEILGQEILTSDKVQLRINFTVQYQVTNLVKALVENKEFEKQLYILVQLALRETIGRMIFDELMQTKDQISTMIMNLCTEKVQNMGVKLVNCGLKDIILPGDIKEIMNQVLIAEKKAQANSIIRREETAATRSLLNTAKLMEENSMLWKLKEMEYVEKIADKVGEITLSGGGNVVEQLKGLFSK